MQADDAVYDFDVLIVGSGPTGGTAAVALASAGIRVHVVSRWNWLANGPRAHITNQRCNEVFRDLGLTDEIERHAIAWDMMGDMLFTTSLAGEELFRMRTWGTGDARFGDYLQASPCGMVDLIQPKLEPILLKAAGERGASFSFMTEYLSHEQDDDGVTVRLRDHNTKHDYTYRVRYLIGADGARSQILNDLDLPVVGELARAGTVYINFEADLAHLVAHRASTLNWIVTPAATFGEIGMGLLRAVEPWNTWIAGFGFDIAQGDPPLHDEAWLAAKIETMIGDPAVAFRIINASVWYVNEAYAPTYSRGRVFCGGDAVHRHPPSSGLGMNTCVQDAHNLAWKLAYVIKGFAGPELLESYTLERAPVGEQIVKRANQSRRDYAAIKACFRVEGAENPVAAGIARFRDPGPDGVAARLRLQDAIDLKQTEFNAQGVEMNQRYVSAAIIPDEGGDAEHWKRDPLLHVQPTTRPGAKLPHAWLVDGDGKRISTLDVTQKGMFTLITGLAGFHWAQAARTLDLQFLKIVVVGEPGFQDLYCDWQRIREIEEAGAVLVRPDGFVAWRNPTGAADEASATALLGDALSAVLGHAAHQTSDSSTKRTFQ